MILFDNVYSNYLEPLSDVEHMTKLWKRGSLGFEAASHISEDAKLQKMFREIYGLSKRELSLLRGIITKSGEISKNAAWYRILRNSFKRTG